jgi:hypothetical protein
MKSRIYITQKDNDKYFKQKLPTFRNGFCYIERVVTFEQDPTNSFDEGEWGYITVSKQKVFVFGDKNSFEIWK